MIKTLIAVIALLAAAPAMATDIAVGEFSGSSIASVGTLSFSASGGLAANGSRDASSVRNESGAAQLAGARGELTFSEVDGVQTTTVDGISTEYENIGNWNIETINGSETTNTDGVEVTQINEAFVDGYDFQRTEVRDGDGGSAAIGGGVSYRVGDATARGSYFGGGVASW